MNETLQIQREEEEEEETVARKTRKNQQTQMPRQTSSSQSFGKNARRGDVACGRFMRRVLRFRTCPPSIKPNKFISRTYRTKGLCYFDFSFLLSMATTQMPARRKQRRFF
jgi:hypothetical protein